MQGGLKSAPHLAIRLRFKSHPQKVFNLHFALFQLRDMDPLTALSLAGNVIQFVEFGTRLLSRAAELYRSTVGPLSVHDEIALVTADLQGLIVRLRQQACEYGMNAQDGDQWERFRKICDEAANVADELVSRIGRLKVKGGKHRKIQSIQQAIRTLWSEDEITRLQVRLSALKEALKDRVLLSIRSVRLYRIDTELTQAEKVLMHNLFKIPLDLTVWINRLSRS